MKKYICLEEFMLEKYTNDLAVELLFEAALPGCAFSNGSPWVSSTADKQTLLSALEKILNNKQPNSLSNVNTCKDSLEKALKNVSTIKCPKEEIDKILTIKLEKLKFLITHNYDVVVNKNGDFEKTKQNLTNLLDRSIKILLSEV